MSWQFLHGGCVHEHFLVMLALAFAASCCMNDTDMLPMIYAGLAVGVPDECTTTMPGGCHRPHDCLLPKCIRMGWLLKLCQTGHGICLQGFQKECLGNHDQEKGQLGSSLRVQRPGGLVERGTVAAVLL